MSAPFNIWRDDNGIPHIEGNSTAEMYKGQGYAHARDRGMQMLLMRILGQGRVSEILDASDDSLKIDMFFRRMNWYGNSEHPVEALSQSSRSFVDAYCKGVNQAFAEKIPFECKLFGYKPTPWVAKDTVLISRMVSYLTLAQSQGEIEHLLIEMVQAGVLDEKLEALFAGLLGGLDRDLINKVNLEERIVPNSVLWDTGAPRMMASNNWVVSGTKTVSGKPILSNDPHLEVNRLPNVWCEMSLKVTEENSEDRWAIGGTMPGLPGVMIGRNNALAWGATYAFVDTIDSWIEKCEGGQYYRESDGGDGDKWRAFKTREEIIHRKKKPSVTKVFYENELGILQGNPFKDEYCLVTRWSGADSGARSFEAIFGLFAAANVRQGMEIYGAIETGWSYVFADNDGNIGFQMSGKVPVRRDGISGLVPLPAWKSENHWQGYVAIADMPRQYNPKCGYVCTANEDLNKYGTANPINMPMGSYRSDRISEILSARDDFTSADMCEMHYDVYSRQAALFMDILRPLLSDTPQATVLKDWDLCYDKDSFGASLFEEFYQELYAEVFGNNGIGQDVYKFLRDETGAFIDFYANFDRVLLAKTSPWFDGRERDEVFSDVARRILVEKSSEKVRWGDTRQYTMTNIFFGGKLPKFLKFDRGPFSSFGGRATIHQCQIYQSGGRTTTFAPSYRIVADFADRVLMTNMAGGPSDRRFSKYYSSDTENWRTGKYKTLTANSDNRK